MLVSFSKVNELKKLSSRVILLYRIKIKPLFVRKPLFYLYKKLGFKILTRDDLIINGDKYLLRHFGFKELVKAHEPFTTKEIPKEIKQIIHPFAITIDQPFVCEVSDAQLTGPTATGFAPDGSIILETTTPFYSVSNHLEGSVSLRALALRNFSRTSVIQLDTACSLVNAWSRNYWHWMIDSLTKLEGIEFYREQTGRKPLLIIDCNPSQWQIDSLKLLGYKSDDCIQWNNSRMQVKRLVISSFRRHYNKVHSIESPQSCRWVRQQILSRIPEDESIKPLLSPKILISRRKAFGRRIINENAVVEALAILGFIDYVLEEMSFLEQVKLFAQAKIIVAPHGAGLTNIIFGQNLTVVELFGSSLPPCFANLSRGLGFQYGCLKCQSPQTGVRRQDSDMIVNVAELMNFVVKMLEH